MRFVAVCDPYIEGKMAHKSSMYLGNVAEIGNAANPSPMGNYLYDRRIHSRIEIARTLGKQIFWEIDYLNKQCMCVT